MINTMGLVQNNTGTNEFLKELKTSVNQYDFMEKDEERCFVDEYVEIMKYEDGSEVLDMSDPLYMDYVFETDEEKKKNLYYRVRRALVWKKSQDEFCRLLARHNIRFVFNLSTKYCKNTRDYDNMISRGLFGLVKAANRFYPFSPVTKPDENGEKIVQFDENGKIIPIKFCTYAKNWIFKYIVGEFMDKTLINIDNKSVSINENVKIKNNVEGKITMENYIDNITAPELTPQRTVQDSVSENENRKFYDNLEQYLKTTNELTALEKEIIVDKYYNKMKTKEIAEKTNNPYSIIQSSHMKALRKIKKHLANNMNVKSFSDIF